MSVLLDAAISVIANTHRMLGREAAIRACDDLIAGALAQRRVLVGFVPTAEYLDRLAHADAAVIAEAHARRHGQPIREEPKRGHT